MRVFSPANAVDSVHTFYYYSTQTFLDSNARCSIVELAQCVHACSWINISLRRLVAMVLKDKGCSGTSDLQINEAAHAIGGCSRLLG